MPPRSRSTAPIARRDAAARKAGEERAALLTPVAKAFSTDIGSEVASLGMQVHGGMGFIEETGAAQHYRDARIAQIYEGTNGIQAIDLVTRKLPMAGGAVVRGLSRRAARDRSMPCRPPTIRPSARPAPRLATPSTRLSARPTGCSASSPTNPDAALAGATPYLRLFGTAAGGCMLADEALAASRLADGAADKPGRVAIARFFAENIAVQAPASRT